MAAFRCQAAWKEGEAGGMEPSCSPLLQGEVEPINRVSIMNYQISETIWLVVLLPFRHLIISVGTRLDGFICQTVQFVIVDLLNGIFEVKLTKLLN